MSSSTSTAPVTIVPILEDNFCYVVEYERNKLALFDPADPPLVQASLEELLSGGKAVTHVFATHHHWDHSGGNDAMVEWLKGKGQEGVVVVGGGEKKGVHRLREVCDVASIPNSLPVFSQKRTLCRARR
mmetsp:Transcript_30376/g.60345  ORF Transcript_30376/g.60345 Transcript_30376/m.60345 type:complete len:129 (+) Transcript_30376:194-580(+)